MVYFPNCKINIGLYITSRRPDGYHELESIFYPLPLRDAVEIIPDKNLPDVIFTQSGNNVSGKTENNLCIKAYRLLKNDFPQLPYCRIHLHKNIPEQAGLGGGSSDAAFTLKLINDIFDLKIIDLELKRYALSLGSDCPFFIENKPCLASGRGENLEPIELDLSNFRIILIKPSASVETKWAYSKIKPNPKNAGLLKELIKLPIASWKDKLGNDFEQPVFETFPEIRDLKDSLYRSGALYASMSGSGSTVFGIFEQECSLRLPGNYYKKWL